MKTIEINLNGKSVKLDTSSIIDAIVNYNADPFLVEGAEEEIINDVIKSMSGADVNSCDPSDADYDAILEQLDLMDADGKDKRDSGEYQLVYDVSVNGAHVLHIAPLFGFELDEDDPAVDMPEELTGNQVDAMDQLEYAYHQYKNNIEGIISGNNDDGCSNRLADAVENINKSGLPTIQLTSPVIDFFGNTLTELPTFRDGFVFEDVNIQCNPETNDDCPTDTSSEEYKKYCDNERSRIEDIHHIIADSIEEYIYKIEQSTRQ